MKNIREKINGITLIALVITIVILIILAGVLINLTLGDNGLFTKSKIAKQKYEYGAAKETLDVKLADIQAECAINGTTYSVKTAKDKLKLDTETQVYVEKIYPEATAKIATTDVGDDVSIKGIVVSVEKYRQYKFLIGKKADSIDIIGITTEDVPETWQTGDLPEGFKTISNFETELGVGVVSGNESGSYHGSGGDTPVVTPPTEQDEEITTTGNNKDVLYLLVQRNTKTALSVTDHANVTFSVGEAIGISTNSSKMTVENNVLTVENDADTTDIITLEIKENETLLNKLVVLVEPTIIANGVTDADGNNPQDAYGIYNANDLVRFREIINYVDNTKNAKVMATNGINLASICYQVDGTIDNDISWSGINTYYGIFDCNNKTINNLYVNTNQAVSPALFITNYGTIKNVILDGAYIDFYSNESYVFVGGICCINSGTIINCANINGTIKSHCTTSTAATALTWAGGIAGENDGIIKNCYNTSLVEGYNAKSKGTNFVGGIVGDAHGGSITENCYNRGTVYSSCQGTNRAGGIVGVFYGTTSEIKNCYNIGSISSSNGSTNHIGGICGDNSAGNGYPQGIISNCYYLDGSATYAYYYYNGSSFVTNNTNQITGANDLYNNDNSTKLKDATTNIDAFKEDTNIINQGYPILDWQ